MSSATAETATRYQRTFHGRADQVAQVRREVAAHLGGCPAADDAILIASELAANAVTHSASAGEFFTIRCEAHAGYVWVECEDLGGPWHCRRPDDRPHGLDLIEALAGPDNWGTETTSDDDRIVWARLGLPQQEGPMREHDLPGHRPHSLGADPMARDDRAAFEAMTTAELKRMCTDLSIAAALAVPGGAGQAAIERQLAQAASALTARESSPPNAA